MTAEMKTAEMKTSLYEEHQKAGAKLVNFGGWQLPVSYTGVLDEHHWVRAHCGIFDVSHMGEVFVSGKDSLAFLQKITINDAARLSPGLGQYTAMLNEAGGMIDDLIIYQLAVEHYLIVVNAANVDKDFAWIEKQARTYRVQVRNASAELSQIAIQGPKSQNIMQSILGAGIDLVNLPYTGIKELTWQGQSILLARTGYTGEWGYEVYLPHLAAVKMWRELLSFKDEVRPIGLGARDTLRLESCYLLYGSDMNETVSPLEAGIAWATKIDKGDFIGRQALLEQKEKGITRKNIAFKMIDAGVARHDMEIYAEDGKKIGLVTSGSVLPTVGGSGGMCLVSAGYAEPGNTIYIDVRGKRKLAKLEKKPLYFPKTKSN